MTDNVFLLGDTVPPGRANDDIVEKLQQLLDDAVTGRIRGFAYVAIYPQSVIRTAWSASDDALYQLAAGTAILQQQYTTNLMEE